MVPCNWCGDLFRPGLENRYCSAYCREACDAWWAARQAACSSDEPKGIASGHPQEDRS